LKEKNSIVAHTRGIQGDIKAADGVPEWRDCSTSYIKLTDPIHGRQVKGQPDSMRLL